MSSKNTMLSIPSTKRLLFESPTKMSKQGITSNRSVSGAETPFHPRHSLPLATCCYYWFIGSQNMVRRDWHNNEADAPFAHLLLHLHPALDCTKLGYFAFSNGIVRPIKIAVDQSCAMVVKKGETEEGKWTRSGQKNLPVSCRLNTTVLLLGCK